MTFSNNFFLFVYIISFYFNKALVVAEVKVGLGAIDGHITLAVLVWIQCSRVNIDIGVDFLYGDGVAAGL